jgi:hypothetical protein
MMTENITKDWTGVVWSSLTQAAGALQVEKKLISMARRSGAAPGFKANGRIIASLFVPWFEKNKEALKQEPDNEEDNEKWRSLRLKNQALLSSIELEEAKANLIAKEEVEQYFISFLISHRNILKDKLVRELPPKLLGKGVIEITKDMEAVVNDLCDFLSMMKVDNISK